MSYWLQTVIKSVSYFCKFPELYILSVKKNDQTFEKFVFWVFVSEVHVHGLCIENIFCCPVSVCTSQQLIPPLLIFIRVERLLKWRERGATSIMEIPHEREYCDRANSQPFKSMLSKKNCSYLHLCLLDKWNFGCNMVMI